MDERSRPQVTHEHVGRTLNFGLLAQGVAFVGIVAVVLYTAFFSTYPPVHDAMHTLRHSLYLIPCH
ncbi:MAG: CbtB-domain containing protein [Gemmatimonadota bacterium]|nr:CbtB-domain containing protein [Gemmatimonadota bacterium]